MAAVAALLAVGVGLFALPVLLIGTHRLPDSAEVLSTTWSSTRSVRKEGKARVRLRLWRRDRLPISSRFIVFAYGGQVTHTGPSAQSLIVLPRAQAPSVRPAAGWNARELIVELEMIPSRPGWCAGDVIVYNDAPVWDWYERLPGFVRERLPDLSARTWKVDLPHAPGQATVYRDD